MLEKHENIEYHYIFHDLVSHKEAGEVHYAISKTNYFISKGSFQKQHDMLQEKIERDKFKVHIDVINHIASLNEEQLKAVKDKKKELNNILKEASNSSHIKGIIQFHDEVIGFFLEWFIKNNYYKHSKIIKSGGRPKGSRNKTTIKKYNWIRDKYYFLIDKNRGHTISEKAKLIRSELLEKKPTWWPKSVYSIETIIDIIKKQKWGD